MVFNLRLNNYQKGVNKLNSLQLDQHFRLTGLNFDRQTKLTFIEQLNYSNINKELRTQARNQEFFRAGEIS